MSGKVKWGQGGYAVVPNRLIDSLPDCISLFALLARYADRDGVAFPGQDAVAEKLGVSRRTVQRRIALLVEHDWLTVHINGAMRTNTYILHDPASDAPPVSHHDAPPMTHHDAPPRARVETDQESVGPSIPPGPPRGGRDYRPIPKEADLHKSEQGKRRDAMKERVSKRGKKAATSNGKPTRVTQSSRNHALLDEVLGQ